MRPTLDPALDKIERGIDLKRLRYFIAVCDYGGISKAASAIGIAQPALTRQIKILEAQIGRPLINRSGRGVEPSRPGRYILDRSREHISSLDGLLRSVRAAFPITQERFVLGLCPPIGSRLPGEFADRVRDDAPHIALSIVEATSADLWRLLDSGHIDLALTYRHDACAKASFTTLLIERFELVRPTDGSASRRRWSLADIAQMRLVLPSKLNEARVAIDRIFDERGFTLKPSLELDSFDAVVLALSQAGAEHASILPHYSIEASDAARRFHRDEIGDPPIHRAIGLVAPADPRSAETLQLVSAHIREAIAKLEA